MTARRRSRWRPLTEFATRSPVHAVRVGNTSRRLDAMLTGHAATSAEKAVPEGAR